MSKKALLVLASMLVVACQGSEVTNPGRLPATPASLGVSDGANGGNDDFWFLPPMVKNPAGNPLYLDNGFDGSLAPTVSVQRIAPTVGLTVILPVTAGADHYAANWQIPTGEATYKISVSVGATELGSADVKTATNGSGLKNIDTNEFIALTDGKTLPIKFVIENCALEDDGCAVVNLTQGGTVETDDGGVDIPPQPNGQTVKVIVEPCEGIPTDLPKKSNCVRVTTDPPLTGNLTVPAVVWVCDGPSGIPSEQEERYTMYRYDAPNTTTALPHAPDQCDPPPPPSFSMGGTVKGMLANLVRGRFRDAGRQLTSLVGPRPVYATTTMLDVGAGGETLGFSDFQLVLPASMAPCPDHPATGLAGAAIAAKVCVSDVGGDAVAGATVHFGSPVSASAVTDAFGVASVNWTLALGPNTLTASGNGIGGTDNSGPRDDVDPFQPLSPHFDDVEDDGPEIPVLVGSITLSSTGANSINAISFGDDGYNSYGPFPISGPFTLPEGWPDPAPGTSPGVGGDSPFGGAYTGCSITNGFPGTTFPENTDVLVTKAFTTPNAGTLTITVQIDNDAKVYLDGADITSTGSSGGASNSFYNPFAANNGVSGWWIHDNCADVNPPVFTQLNVPAGNHTLSIWAHDRGTVGYLNAQIVLTPSSP